MSQRNVSVRLSTEGGQQARSELDRFGRGGQQSLNRIRDSSRPASQGLLAVNAASREVRSGLEGVARQAGPVGSVLVALGPGGLAAAAGIAAVTTAAAALVRGAEDSRNSMLRLEAIVEATGNRSGVTATQITEMASAISRDTLAASSAVEEAATQLLAFRVTGTEAFERTLRVAQDMSAVIGGDVRQNVERLGRALDEPERGLTSLERRFGSFSDELRRNVEEMIAVGDRAGATDAILGELERRVGGAGAAEAGGITGAANRASEAWRDFLDQLSETLNLGPAVETTLKNIAESLEFFTGAMSDAEVGADVVRRTNEALEAQRRLREDFDMTVDAAKELRDRIESGETAPDFAAPNIVALVEQYERAEAAVSAARERGQREVEQREAAQAGAREARAADVADTIRGIEEDLSDELRRQTETRRDIIQREYQERLDQLRGIQDTITRDMEGGDIEPRAATDLQRDLRSQIEAAQELRDTQLREIEEQEAEAARRAEETAQRRADAEAARISSRLQGNARVVAELERELELLTTMTEEERERAQFIDQAVGRLSDASTGRIMQVREMAEALFEERQRHEELNEVRREAERLARSMVPEEERLLELRQQLTDAAEAGAISEEKYARAMEALEERMEGLSRSGESAVDTIESAIGSTTRLIGVNLPMALMEGENAWERFGDTVTNVLSRITEQLLEMAIVSPFMDAVGGLNLGSIFGGSGGGQTVDSAPLGPAPTLDIPPMFASGGMHGGGLRIVGERGPELEATGPARIWSADRTRAMVGGGGDVHVQIINQGGQPMREQSRSQQRMPNGDRMVKLMVRQMLTEEMDSGNMDRVWDRNGIVRRPRNG